MKLYRIKCAQVRSTDPLVVRTRSGIETTIAVGGDPAAPLTGDGIVRLVIDAGEGVPSVPDLPQDSDDFAPNYVQFTFQGAATASVDGPFLTIESEGLLWVTSGAEFLPVSESWLREAESVAVETSTDDPPPHVPV